MDENGKIAPEPTRNTVDTYTDLWVATFERIVAVISPPQLIEGVPLLRIEAAKATTEIVLLAISKT